MARIGEGMSLLLMGGVSLATIFAVLATSSFKKAAKLSVQDQLAALDRQVNAATAKGKE